MEVVSNYFYNLILSFQTENQQVVNQQKLVLSPPLNSVLKHNGSSLHILNDHKGEIFFSKWNPTKNFLATGGAGDNVVDIWDFDLVSTKNEGPN